MLTVLIVIHILLALAMIGVILLQRSEGGALGIGGGNSLSQFMGRQPGNTLSRVTTILAIAFFITSLILAILVNKQTHTASSILDEEGPETTEQPVEPTPGNLPAISTSPTVPVNKEPLRAPTPK